MTSSWISAAAWKNSSAAAARDDGSPSRAAGRAPAPVAEGGAQPLAAAHEVADVLDQRAAVRAHGVQHVALPRQELLHDLVHPGAQVLGVERRRRGSAEGAPGGACRAPGDVTASPCRRAVG